jgi:hypothetical protein
VRRWRAIPPLLGLLASAGPLSAQALPGDAARPGLLTDPGKALWVRPLASLIVPGGGQLLGGRARGALYLVAEALLITRTLGLNSEGRREQDRYRELAMVVARGQFDPVEQDTVFEYYEQMGRYVESGPFDTDPGPGFAPPTDTRTYNGQIWELARTTFFPDPANEPLPESAEYQRAVAFYQSRAIGPNYQWSWRNAGLEQDLFRQTIAASDEAFREATTTLGLLLANHLLSAVDAFVSERLSRPDRPVTLRTGFVSRRAGGAMPAMTAVVSIAW